MFSGTITGYYHILPFNCYCEAHMHHTDNLIWISIILYNIAPFCNTPKCTKKHILLFTQSKYTFCVKVFVSFLELQILLIFRKKTNKQQKTTTKV